VSARTKLCSSQKPVASSTLSDMRVDSPARFRQPIRLATEEERQQVAAICYRVRKSGIQFLLVQSRGGRWIFPKGGAEPGITFAQSAALEAFEEAGAHGRIEANSFTRYSRLRSSDTARSSGEGLAVIAYLCEVSRLETPQESNRNPTWFSPSKAKHCLRERRSQDFGAELARVIDRAVIRIQRLQTSVRAAHDQAQIDELRKVRFDAFASARIPDDLAARVANQLIRQNRQARSMVAIDAQFHPYLQRKLRTAGRPVLRLGPGTISRLESPRNITAIDSKPKAIAAKSGSTSSMKMKRKISEKTAIPTSN
jgi:8-oxo-dGTP pyrophosphatase MutT (NUDIX family)